MHETRTYRSDPGELADIRGFVRAACVSGWSDGGEKAVEALILAVHEVVANIMRHAYEGHKECEIELSVDVDDERACVCLGDTGIPFDHTAVPPPQFDGSRTGGFGVYLVGELVDEVDYSTDSGKNVCRLVKRRV